MYSELDFKAHEIYVNSMIIGEGNYYRKIENFYNFKKNYTEYYIQAKIKIRKEKLEKLNYICSQN